MFGEGHDQMRKTANGGFGNKWKPEDHAMGGLQPGDDDSDEDEGVEGDDSDEDENLEQDDEASEESDHNF